MAQFWRPNFFEQNGGGESGDHPLPCCIDVILYLLCRPGFTLAQFGRDLGRFWAPFLRFWASFSNNFNHVSKLSGSHAVGERAAGKIWGARGGAHGGIWGPMGPNVSFFYCSNIAASQHYMSKAWFLKESAMRALCGQEKTSRKMLCASYARSRFFMMMDWATLQNGIELI